MNTTSFDELLCDDEIALTLSDGRQLRGFVRGTIFDTLFLETHTGIEFIARSDISATVIVHRYRVVMAVA